MKKKYLISYQTKNGMVVLNYITPEVSTWADALSDLTETEEVALILSMVPIDNPLA